MLGSVVITVGHVQHRCLLVTKHTAFVLFIWRLLVSKLFNGRLLLLQQISAYHTVFVYLLFSCTSGQITVWDTHVAVYISGLSL